MERKNEMMKNIVRIILTLLVLCCIPTKVMAAEAETKDVDFVLVLDCSGSMESSDPEELSISAAKMFVDMLPVENTRIAVVGFGPNWGSESYVLDYESGTDTMAKVAYNLDSVSTDKEKTQVKDAISGISGGGSGVSYTNVGYALATSIDILNKGNAANDSACIVLMSDGRVSEPVNIHKQDAYTEGNTTLFKSIEKAIADASAKEWPIYCLELNYDNLTKQNWKKNTAIIQMTRIAEGTGGARIEISSPAEIDTAFSDIFSRFFEISDADSQIFEGTIEDGKFSRDFSVGEMTAESSIVISGTAAAEITAVEITDPKGVAQKYTKSEVTDSRIITYESDKYVMVKLLQPAVGDWNITAYGKNGIKIKVMAKSIREMNLSLSTQRSADEVIPKGSKVDFTASFVYNEHSYSSETFYKENEAYLEIVETGEKFQMESGVDNYTGTVTFSDSGTWTIRAVVESGHFRSDRKESGVIKFTVDNLPTSATGKMEDLSLNLNETVEIDCSKYFENPDNDKLDYSIDVDKTAGMTAEFSENGVMTLKTGAKAGEFDFVIYASDGAEAGTVSQSFKISIVNKPAAMIGGDTIKVKTSYNQDKFPSWLLNILGVERTSSGEIICDDHFTDEDGIPLIYEIKGLDKDAVVEVTDETAESGKILVVGKEKGKCEFILSATDASDENIVLEKTIKVDSVDMKAYVWNQVKWKVIGILAAIIVIIGLLASAFLGIRIHGLWDVSVGSQIEEEIRLGRLSSGKKRKCTLNSILVDLDLPLCTSDQIVLKGGNNWTKHVTILGLEHAQEVEFKGVEYDQIQKKLTKQTLKKRDSISFKVDGDWFTLKRY